MDHTERRAARRVRCNSISARITTGRYSIPVLVSDVSSHGLRLVGADLPGKNSSISIAVAGPRLEHHISGRVMWTDPAHHAIGVALAAGTLRPGQDLGQDLGRPEPEGRGAVLLVDEPRTAALLCEPLRRHGYIPYAVSTPLEAVACLARARPSVELAVVSPRAFGMPAQSLLELLASEFPQVCRIAIGAAANDGTISEHVLSSARPEHDLEALLHETDRLMA